MKSVALLLTIVITMVLCIQFPATAALAGPIQDCDDPLPEAQSIAIELSGEFYPPEDLTQTIFNDLAAIRQLHPELASVTHRADYVCNELVVGITPEAAEQYLAGDYHELDELNAQYGVVEIETYRFSPSRARLTLIFDQVMNMPLLADIYEAANLDGVRYVNVNSIGSFEAYSVFGDSLIADPPVYTFRYEVVELVPNETEIYMFRTVTLQFTVIDGQVFECGDSEIYVDPLNGSDDNLGYTTDQPKLTIQAAIEMACDGDTVILLPGTYTGAGSVDNDFLGKAITIRSIEPNDPCVVAATIIDCNGSEDDPHRAFIFQSEEDANSILAGLTIINGVAPIYIPPLVVVPFPNPPFILDPNFPVVVPFDTAFSDMDTNLIFPIFDPNAPLPLPMPTPLAPGGAILCTANTNPEITSCVMKHNQAIDLGYQRPGAMFPGPVLAKGGAIACLTGSNPRIHRCTFEQNSSGYYGGALYCAEVSELSNCVFTVNMAYEGGAIRAVGPNDISLRNCLLAGNHAHQGGAVHLYNKDMNIVNCTIIDNRARELGDAIFVGESIIDAHSGVIDITNSIVRNNDIVFAGPGSWGPWVPIGSPFQPAIYFLPAGRVGRLWISYTNTDEFTPDHREQIWGPGNINADPCFKLPGYWDQNGTTPDIDIDDDFYVPGNYRLLPDSLCIDAGDPDYIAEPNDTDLAGNPRVINSIIDMGAYEYAPPAVIEAGIRIIPRILNLQSKGRFVFCVIRLPEDYKVADIDRDSILLQNQIEPRSVFISRNYRFALAIFSRADLQGILKIGRVELSLTGWLNDGTPFEGADTVRVIKPRRFRR